MCVCVCVSIAADRKDWTAAHHGQQTGAISFRKARLTHIITRRDSLIQIVMFRILISVSDICFLAAPVPYISTLSVINSLTAMLVSKETYCASNINVSATSVTENWTDKASTYTRHEYHRRQTPKVMLSHSHVCNTPICSKFHYSVLKADLSGCGAVKLPFNGSHVHDMTWCDTRMHVHFWIHWNTWATDVLEKQAIAIGHMYSSDIFFVTIVGSVSWNW